MLHEVEAGKKQGDKTKGILETSRRIEDNSVRPKTVLNELKSG